MLNIIIKIKIFVYLFIFIGIKFLYFLLNTQTKQKDIHIYEHNFKHTYRIFTNIFYSNEAKLIHLLCNKN